MKNVQKKINDSIELDFRCLDSALRFNSNFEINSSKLGENVFVFPGSIGKSGLGIRHIIEERFNLPGVAYDKSSMKKNREATEAIKTVIANYSNSDGYSYFRNQVGAVITSLDLNITQILDKSSNCKKQEKPKEKIADEISSVLKDMGIEKEGKKDKSKNHEYDGGMCL